MTFYAIRNDNGGYYTNSLANQLFGPVEHAFLWTTKTWKETDMKLSGDCKLVEIHLTVGQVVVNDPLEG